MILNWLEFLLMNNPLPAAVPWCLEPRRFLRRCAHPLEDRLAAVDFRPALRAAGFVALPGPLPANESPSR